MSEVKLPAGAGPAGAATAARPRAPVASTTRAAATPERRAGFFSRNMITSSAPSSSIRAGWLRRPGTACRLSHPAIRRSADGYRDDRHVVLARVLVDGLVDERHREGKLRVGAGSSAVDRDRGDVGLRPGVSGRRDAGPADLVPRSRATEA